MARSRRSGDHLARRPAARHAPQPRRIVGLPDVRRPAAELPEPPAHSAGAPSGTGGETDARAGRAEASPPRATAGAPMRLHMEDRDEMTGEAATWVLVDGRLFWLCWLTCAVLYLMCRNWQQRERIAHLEGHMCGCRDDDDDPDDPDEDDVDPPEAEPPETATGPDVRLLN